MADVANNAMNAALAYRQAVEEYGNFVDSAMRQYGWTMPDASGQYSVQGAQDAFDPDRVIQYDTSGKPVFNVAETVARTAGGQYGTTGLFAQTAQESAAQEAEARAAARGRGLRGGVASQQERLAETLAGRQMGTVSAGLFQDVFARYGGLGKAYQQIAVGEATDAAINAANLAASMPTTNPMAAPEPAPVTTVAAPPAATILPASERSAYRRIGNPGGSPPANPQPGEVYQGGPQGLKWVYRTAGPKGKGWYRK
jgi:hypothetical protein